MTIGRGFVFLEAKALELLHRHPDWLWLWKHLALGELCAKLLNPVVHEAGRLLQVLIVVKLFLGGLAVLKSAAR